MAAELEAKARALAAATAHLRNIEEQLEKAETSLCRERYWGCSLPLALEVGRAIDEVYNIVGSEELEKARKAIAAARLEVARLREKLEEALSDAVVKLLAEEHKERLISEALREV